MDFLKTHFKFFVYNFWSSFDLLNMRALSKVEKKLLTLKIDKNWKFDNP